MLIKFTVENYLSIKDKVSIELIAKSIKEGGENNIFNPKGYKGKLLKGMALMGPNSGGKSNILKALAFVKDFVLNSFSEVRANEKIDIENFRLSNESIEKPSLFEIEFIADNIKYRYGFKVDKNEIHKEWLYYGLKTTEKYYFIREKDKELKLQDNFKEGWKTQELIRPNALLLTTSAQLNGPISKLIFQWFQGITFLSDTDYLNYINLTAIDWQKENRKSYLKRLLVKANLGFDEVEIKQIKNDLSSYTFIPEEVKRIIKTRNPYQFQIETIHKKFHNGKYSGNEKFNLRSDESQGTQKFFSFLGPIIESLLSGGLILIDELDARLHPNLAIILVNLFNSVNDNKFGAQLIFSSHNSLILKKKSLRRDQIAMVYKSKNHNTILETYHDLGVRSDAAYDIEYLNLEEKLAFGVRDSQLDLFD